MGVKWNELAIQVFNSDAIVWFDSDCDSRNVADRVEKIWVSEYLTELYALFSRLLDEVLLISVAIGYRVAYSMILRNYEFQWE